MDGSLQEWANSLVGRDWEIYWRDDGCCEEKIPPGTQESNARNSDVADDDVPENDNDPAAEDVDEEIEEDIEDWYDGRILAVEDLKETSGKFSFRVSFVGDETIYSMELEPSWVRPAARAWIERSKALLSSQYTLGNSTSFDDWEKSLPLDTSTVDDRTALARIEIQPLEYTANAATEGSRDNFQQFKADYAPCNDEMEQIRRLSYLLCEQIYLRSRLATIVEHLGDGGPSELYVEHLLQCLKQLDASCRWYMRCWDLHGHIFCTSTAASPASSTQHASKLREDFAITDGLQEGRRLLLDLLKVDTSMAGAKRRRPLETASSGTRRTKRRRKNKSFEEFVKESGRGSETPNPEEDEFLSWDIVNDFVQQLKCHDHRWYLGHFGNMLLSLSSNIVQPYSFWRHRVEVLLGDRPDSEIDDANSDGATSEEDSDDDGDGMEGERQLGTTKVSSKRERRYYSYDDIKAFQQLANHDQILRRFDLARWQERLCRKLDEVENFERHAWSVIPQLFAQPTMSGDSKQCDRIYSELLEMRSNATSSDSAVGNVFPLGRPTSVLSRDLIDDAIDIRSWYLDLYRIETSKERLVFIEKLAAKASELPRLPPCEHSFFFDSPFDEAVTRLKTISQRYFDHLSRFNKYRSVLLARSNVNDGGLDFLTVEGVSQVLQELADNGVLSVAEEMLSVRFDVLTWKKNAENLLSKSHMPFEELVALKKSLDLISSGSSPTRARMLASIESNEKVDNEIRTFAEADISALCGPLLSTVKSKHSVTSAWKERADPVVNALEQYRGKHQSSQKPPPMIDLKRINGLLSEYNSLGIFLPQQYAFLEEVSGNADRWSKELMDALCDEAKTFSELLECLQTSKINRPKGIIVDPARHVVDSLVELLLWYQQAVTTRNSGAQVVQENSDDNAADQAISVGCQVSKTLYQLITEGSEILALFSNRRHEHNKFVVSSAAILSLVAKQLDSRRPMRVQSRSKLESNPLSNTILGRLISEDDETGCPLRFLLLFVWRITVLDFVDKYQSKEADKDRMTLEQGKTLMLQKPYLRHCTNRGSACDVANNSIVLPMGCDGEVKLRLLVSQGEKIEEEALKTIATAKELFRGPLRQEEAIRDHLVKIKELINDFRAARSERKGLILSQKLECQLEQNLKAFGWVVRTFPYPFLHQVHCDLLPQNRITWDTLVNLSERKPAGLENMGDCAGIALRAAELYEAAKLWQDEITKVTMLSNRGGKRRGDGYPGESDGGSQTTVVDVEKVHRLAKDPVLLKVDMPREGAVTEVVERANVFETQMHNFLGKDYDGFNPDRAPYPEASSLIGNFGEFLLYRLTGSPLYSSLMSFIDLIATTAQDVFADTPGKVAFEWIRQAVYWIDSLREAVIRKTYYPASSLVERLVIAEADARKILESGKELFLDIPEDLKKTLSKHMIYVSTNRVEQKLTVVFKKGGAHYSIGGTAIRWCPLLFDSLRRDIQSLEEWKIQADKVQEDFTVFLVENESQTDEKNLLLLSDLYTEATLLIEEGFELIIAPPKDVAELLSKLQASIIDHVQRLSDYEMMTEIRQKRFKSPTSVLNDRFELLDSLLSRSALEYDSDDLEAPSLENLEIPQGSFRDTCRLYLEKALRKGIQLMELQQEDPELKDITSCITKAWEVELEMYNRFQADHDENVISPEYRDKARSLRRGFEDNSSPKLCIQVLLGEIDAADLVSMPDEQILGIVHEKQETSKLEAFDVQAVASPSYLSDEELGKAAEAPTIIANECNGSKSTIVAAQDEEFATMEIAKETKASQNPAASDVVRSALTNVELTSNESMEPSPALDETKSDTTSKDLANGKAHSENNMEISVASPEKKLSSNIKSEEENDAMHFAATSHRPEAPPSLAATLTTSSSSAKRTSNKKSGSKGSSFKRGKYVTNSSGDNTFIFSICKPTIKFTARFYLENESQARICGLLPDSLNEKGRLRIDEFAKFLSGKLKGGRWIAVPMRLRAHSEEDSKKYKKYYREYESMKRIAMFAIGENTKLFLVTPKFHRAAAKAMGTSFHVDASTYAVVMTREMHSS